MTEKRYKLSEPNGAYLIDNDRPYAHWINDDDKIIDLLNELSTENRQLKKQIETEHQMLDNAILLERTRMGKNCLKQFKQQLGGNND